MSATLLVASLYNLSVRLLPMIEVQSETEGWRHIRALAPLPDSHPGELARALGSSVIH